MSVFSDSVWGENASPGSGGMNIEPGSDENQILAWRSGKWQPPEENSHFAPGVFIDNGYNVALNRHFNSSAYNTKIWGAYNRYPYVKFWNYGQYWFWRFILSSTKFFSFEYLPIAAIRYNDCLIDAGKISMIDGAVETIAPEATAGWGRLIVGDMEEYARFRFKSSGVDIEDSSANIAGSDIAGKCCVFRNAANELVIKNNLGAGKTIVYEIKYMEI